MPLGRPSARQADSLGKSPPLRRRRHLRQEGLSAEVVASVPVPAVWHGAIVAAGALVVGERAPAEADDGEIADLLQLLTDVVAKRRIIDAYFEVQDYDSPMYASADDYMETVVRELASAYADHEEYRDEWAD